MPNSEPFVVIEQIRVVLYFLALLRPQFLLEGQRSLDQLVYLGEDARTLDSEQLVRGRLGVLQVL